MIKVIPLFCFNSLRNFTYLVLGENATVCIDPYDGPVVFEYLSKHNLKLDIILNTHEHFDHIRGNEFLLSNTSAKLLKPKPSQIITLAPDDYLKTIFTPGHTMDHLCFQGFEQNKPTCFFAGDTLFNGGIGNCKNGGIKEVLYDTIQMLKNLLNDESIIYPGHDYFVNNLEFSKTHSSFNEEQQMYLKMNPKAENSGFPFLTFKQEKTINPFLNLNNKEDFLKLRTLRDQW